MDFVTDLSGRHLVRLEQLTTVPPYVKSATVNAEAFEGLSDHLFADPVRREFPCDTPGHTFLSFAYHRSAAVNSPDVLDRIKVAAERHGITGDITALDLVFEGVEKQAQVKPERHFAVKIDFGAGDPQAVNVHVKQGGVHGFYPLDTPDEIVDSAIRLGNDRHRIMLELFAEGCTNIMKAAAAQNLPWTSLPAIVRQYGTERLPDFDIIESEASKRAAQYNDDTYNEIVKLASENPEGRPMTDYIGLWIQADAVNGVTYSPSVQDPYLIFNSGISKAAFDAEVDRWTLINNVPIPKVALANLNPQKVGKRFTKASAEKIIALTKKAATNEDLDSDISALSDDARRLLLGVLAEK